MMVDFDPKFTETVFLDIECYIPHEYRQQGKSSMINNPAIPDNYVLGGVFQGVSSSKQNRATLAGLELER